MESFWEPVEIEHQAITGGVRQDPVQTALERFEATYEPSFDDSEPASDASHELSFGP